MAEPSDLPILVEDIAGELHPPHDLHVLVVLEALGSVGLGDGGHGMGQFIHLERLVLALQSPIQYQRNLDVLAVGEQAIQPCCSHHSNNFFNKMS